MAKTDNLTDFLTGIANAIRTKKGTSEPINVQDFESEISNLSGGDVLVISQEQYEGFGTVVPNEGTISGVYFNTNLSVSEVEKMFERAKFVFMYGDTSVSIAPLLFTDGVTICLQKEIGNKLSIIDQNGGELYWANEEYINEHTGYNVGWQDFTQPIEITSALISEITAYDLLIIVGETNNKLVNLFSTTPITYNAKDYSMYKVYNNTTLANSGTIEGIYFNTDIIGEDFYNLLNNLSWIPASSLGLSGFSFYPVLAYMNGSYPYVLAFKKFDEGGIDLALINFETMATIQDFYVSKTNNWGTFTNPYPINATVLNSLSGIPIGAQNEVIKLLISSSSSKKIVYYFDGLFQEISENTIIAYNSTVHVNASIEGAITVPIPDGYNALTKVQVNAIVKSPSSVGGAGFLTASDIKNGVVITNLKEGSLTGTYVGNGLEILPNLSTQTEVSNYIKANPNTYFLCQTTQGSFIAGRIYKYSSSSVLNEYPAPNTMSYPS